MASVVIFIFRVIYLKSCIVMINHKLEFRKGNLVWHCLLGISKVLEIRNDGISICNPNNESNAYFIANENLGQIDYLDISKELLLKSGFKPSETDELYLGLPIFTSTIWSDFSDNFSIAVLRIRQTDIQIKHFHRLQNLYYDLKCSELPFSSTEP